MPIKRIITDELLNRVHRAEDIIHAWMTSNSISETTPEDCMEELVKNNLYTYDSKGKAHHFRED